MAITDIADFDIAAYQTAPLLSAVGTRRLCIDLDRGKPANAPQHVLDSAARMIETAKKLGLALAERVESPGAGAATEVEFDVLSDRFWTSTRGHCELCMHYSHPAFAMLSAAAKLKIKYEDKLRKAEIARELDHHLFGSTKLAFLRGSFKDQVEQTGIRLTFIQTSANAAGYAEVLLDGDLLNTLAVLQERYDEMVHDRAMRDDTLTDLRILRTTAQRHILLYAGAVMTMLDESSPASFDVVTEALQPMRNARNRPNYGHDDEDTEAEGEATSDETPLVDPPPVPESDGEAS